MTWSGTHLGIPNNQTLTSFRGLKNVGTISGTMQTLNSPNPLVLGHLGSMLGVAGDFQVRGDIDLSFVYVQQVRDRVNVGGSTDVPGNVA